VESQQWHYVDWLLQKGEYTYDEVIIKKKNKTKTNKTTKTKREQEMLILISMIHLAAQSWYKSNIEIDQDSNFFT
jgi:hypothetical protein